MPAANRLGEEGEGFKIAMTALDNGRYTVAAGAAGLIQASLEASSRTPTSARPLACRLLSTSWSSEWSPHGASSTPAACWSKAGWMKNRGLRNTRETTLAKWYCTEAARRRRRCHPDSWRLWLLRRVHRRALPAQHKERRHLRRNLADSHADAGRLRAQRARRSADAVRDAGF